MGDVVDRMSVSLPVRFRWGVRSLEPTLGAPGEVAPLPNWGRVTMPRSGVPGHRVECRAVPPEPPATRPRLARVGSYLEGNQALLSGMLAATRNEWDVAGYGRLAGGRLAGARWFP